MLLFCCQTRKPHETERESQREGFRSRHQWVNEARWEDEDRRVILGFAECADFILGTRLTCAPVKHRQRQLNTGRICWEYRNSTQRCLPRAGGRGEGGGSSSLIKTAKSSQWNSKVYYICFTSHAFDNFTPRVRPRNIFTKPSVKWFHSFSPPHSRRLVCAIISWWQKSQVSYFGDVKGSRLKRFFFFLWDYWGVVQSEVYSRRNRRWFCDKHWVSGEPRENFSDEIVLLVSFRESIEHKTPRIQQI